MKLFALRVAIGLSLLVIGAAFWTWDHGRVRVHSVEQAIEMAKTAAGPQVRNLPVRVETEQDFWTVRFGPDENGKVHSYLVTIWDRHAGGTMEQTATVDLKLD
ncbi:hypothetical protein BH11PSE1_BH11PSE1_27950 [soil metagenome]